MKVRLGIISQRVPDFWDSYVPQKDTRIDEVEIEIPPIPDGWIVSRAMILMPDEEAVEV